MMPETYRILAAVDLPILVGPPPLITAPLRNMMTAEEAPTETLVYRVPEGCQAIVKLIVWTSDQEAQDITMRCYEQDAGPVPLLGRIHLEPHEWAEWTGTLTLGSGSEVRGAVSGGHVSIAIYGMERSR